MNIEEGSDVFMLEISDAKKSDSGRYKVIAHNAVGETSQEVFVNVAGEARKPRSGI